MNDNTILNEELIEETTSPETENTPDSSTEAESAPAPQPSQVVAPTPYSQNYYLRYGNKEKTCVDLDGTSKLLQALGFDGGELRQAREGHETLQTYKGEEGDSSGKMFCSYCGLEITGIEYQRLPDGRLRCTGCSSSLVKSEMQELCDRVRTNMEAFFGAAINVPISIEVIGERKLKKKLKAPLSTIDDKSILVLGAAINDKKGYRILLENGAPRISVIATFAHELTHIWQYVNWDNKKGFNVCAPDKRLLMYEGMAKWAEIQYLYLIGETAVARREEFITRNRDDEYGVGFRMIENKYPLAYGTIVCDNAPFTKDAYPID